MGRALESRTPKTQAGRAHVDCWGTDFYQHRCWRDVAENVSRVGLVTLMGLISEHVAFANELQRVKARGHRAAAVRLRPISNGARRRATDHRAWGWCSLAVQFGHRDR